MTRLGVIVDSVSMCAAQLAVDEKSSCNAKLKVDVDVKSNGIGFGSLPKSARVNLGGRRANLK